MKSNHKFFNMKYFHDVKTCTRNCKAFLSVTACNPILLRHSASRTPGMQQSDFEKWRSKYFDIASKKEVVRLAACSIKKQVGYLWMSSLISVTAEEKMSPPKLWEWQNINDRLDGKVLSSEPTCLTVAYVVDPNALSNLRL